MPENVNHSDLLAFIEGGLSEDESTRVRRRLAARPELLNAIDAMRADRETLRTEPEPVIPADLVADLEPLLARPMLIGSGREQRGRVGVYRARHRRARWMRPRIAIAAGFVLLVGAAAVLLTVTPLREPFGSPEEVVIQRRDAESVAQPLRAPEESSDETRSDGTLLADSSNQAATSEPPRRTIELKWVTLASGDSAIEAGFAIDLSAVGDRDALDRLIKLSAETKRSAIVRNFSYHEAEAAWNDLVARSDFSSREKEELLAAMSKERPRRGTIERSNRERVRSVVRRTKVKLGEHLTGPRELAAIPEQQLRFQEAGARHTLTISASDLLALVAQLDEEFAGNVLLRPFVEADESAPLREEVEATQETRVHDAALSAWQRWRQWREAMHGLVGSDAKDRDALFVVPIVTTERGN